MKKADVTKKLSDIAKVQKKDAKGKYKQVKRGNKNHEVHEYVAPNGTGYQVLFYKEDEGKKYFKSKGYGPEADSRTFDWTLIEEE